MRREDWALQACCLDSTSDSVWLNRVGTSGIARAGYWLSRLASGAAPRSTSWGPSPPGFSSTRTNFRITASGSSKLEAIS